MNGWKQNQRVDLGGGGAKKTASFLISGRHAIIKNYLNGSLLLLYSPEVVRAYSFKSIIKSALGNGALCVYTGPEVEDFKETFRVEEEKKKFKAFLLTERNVPSAVEKLDRFIDSTSNTKNTVFLINDFFNAANDKNLQYLLELQKKISEKSKNKKLHAINAFDISALDSNRIEALVACNQKAIFTSDREMVLSFLPEKIGQLKTSVKIFPHTIGERFVKDSLEHIIYSMLLKNPICGHDVIRRIANDYHVALSQGTVYPVLYSLHEKGIVTVAKDSKAKMYSLTEEGKEITKKELSAMRDAHTHFLSLMD